MSCSDDVVWQVINQQFCSWKLTTDKKESFCRNEYNVSGLCSRQTCPLANSRYATVRSVNGRIYLYIKTAERQHMPSKWWERIKLSKNYQEALAQIDQHLLYWQPHMIDRCKQRLTRLAQVAIAERRLAMKEHERHYTSVAPKVRRREETRERKALVAAKLERAIEKELLDRMKSGAYGDQPLNVDEKVWAKVLKGVEANTEQELNEESESEAESDVGEVEYVEAEDEDEEEVPDLEDLEKWLGSPSKESESSSEDEAPRARSDRLASLRRPRVEIEFEHDLAQEAR